MIRLLTAVLAFFTLTGCTPRQWIAVYWPNETNRAKAEEVAWCESRMDPGAVSPTNDHGLFQINATYHRASFEEVTGQPWSMVYDAFWNTVYAKHLYDRQGWQPWTCRDAA